MIKKLFVNVTLILGCINIFQKFNGLSKSNKLTIIWYLKFNININATKHKYNSKMGL